MARPIGLLSARAVATIAKPGRHADGGSLYLVVGKDGARRWTFMYQRDGRQREMGLGSLTYVSLALARRIAQAQRELLASGIDPLDAKHAERSIPTFGEVADKVLEIAVAASKNAAHQAQWKNSIEVKAKDLRDKRVDQITTDDVLKIVEPLWATQNETASRLRGRIERVLDYAKAKKWRSGENPAAWKGNLDHLLGSRKKLARGHHAAMPFEDVAAFVAALHVRTSNAARALEFLILTAARTGEVLGATWQEVDLKAATWTIPGERMKAGREHRVPLSARAIAILEEMRLGLKPSPADPVFPGPRRTAPMSNMAILALLKRMKVDVTAHGFRSSFRDWAGERTNFPREIAEAALAHLVGDEVERAYRRGDALDKRRKLLDAWAAFVAKPGNMAADVVPIVRKKVQA